jgi:hypothetical protein
MGILSVAKRITFVVFSLRYNNSITLSSALGNTLWLFL